MKFYGGAGVSKKNKWSNFGPDEDHHDDCQVGNQAIIQKAMKGLQWNFMERSGMIKGTSDYVWWWSASQCWLSNLKYGHYSVTYQWILMPVAG